MGFMRIFPVNRKMGTVMGKQLAVVDWVACFFVTLTNIVRLTIEPGAGETKGQLIFNTATACDDRGEERRIALKMKFLAEVQQAMRTGSVALVM